MMNQNDAKGVNGLNTPVIPPVAEGLRDLIFENFLAEGDIKLIQSALAFYHSALREDQADQVGYPDMRHDWLGDEIDRLEGLQYRLPFLEVNICAPAHPNHLIPEAGYCCGTTSFLRCRHECCRDTAYDREAEQLRLDREMRRDDMVRHDPLEDMRLRNDEQRDYAEEAYNLWLMNGGDV